MQKQSMFQSFLKKKQLISKMITDSKSPRNRQHFHHFEAVSQPVYIKAQSNAIYLTHLNTQFKDQLREFVHQQQSFKQTMFQLAKITESIQNENDSLQKEYKKLRSQLNEVELQKQCLSDKNDIHLQKIMTLQEQAKSQQMRGEQYQKIAITLEEDIQYENCISTEIKVKNTEVVEKLQIKSAQIQASTFRLQNIQKDIRQKDSKLKNFNKDIKSLYFTLQAQDEALSHLCTAIQQGLNKQNNHINDIEFVKEDLSRVLTESQKRKKELNSANQTEHKLLNYYEDLEFDLRRTTKQLQIEQKGIDEQYWKIQSQKQRLIENRQMLAELQQFLLDLLHKNQMMEHCLEEQIIQDYAVKKVVQSKCMQPVGKKTRLFLQQIQDKELASTKTSWCKENLQTPQTNKITKQSYTTPINQFSPMSPSLKRNIVQKHIGSLYGRVPQQMEFIFDNFNEFQEEEQLSQEKEDQCVKTGFSYIDRLSRFQYEA